MSSHKTKLNSIKFWIEETIDSHFSELLKVDIDESEDISFVRQNVKLDGKGRKDKWNSLTKQMAELLYEIHTEETSHHPDCPYNDGFGCHCDEL